MLARKFASDFSERQMTAPVTFDEEARQRLLRYRWPGNVRQLKNIIDQVALFHAGHEVTAADLEEYLPEAATRYIPATTSGTATGHDYATEREALVGMVLGLRRELEELRREVDRLSGARGAVEPLLPLPRASSGDSEGVSTALVAAPPPRPLGATAPRRLHPTGFPSRWKTPSATPSAAPLSATAACARTQLPNSTYPSAPSTAKSGSTASNDPAAPRLNQPLPHTLTSVRQKKTETPITHKYKYIYVTSSPHHRCPHT